MQFKKIALACAAPFMLATSMAQANVAEISFMFSDDDPDYIKYMEDKAAEFSAAHDDIQVNFVPSGGYETMRRQLPVYLATGHGPDIAKYTDATLLEYALDLSPYLKDEEAYRELHGDTLGRLTIEGLHKGDEINGYMASRTVNLPFINKTLFEMAGEPIPEPGYTINDLVEASARVADATGVEIPFAIDRSGHRLSGLIYSEGGDYFAEDGSVSFPDEATRSLFSDMVEWVESDAFPRVLWGAAGGDAYKSMSHEFMNADAVTYFSGNWMINPFASQIGNIFEWQILPAPTGSNGAYSWEGITYMTAFKHTKHPEAVARFMEYLASEEVQREITENFIMITGADIQDPQYKTDNEAVLESMTIAADTARNHLPNVHANRTLRQNRIYSSLMGVYLQNFTRVIVGEISQEQAFEAMQSEAELIARDYDIRNPEKS